MRFEWDLRKSQSNRAKHHVSFELAESIFLDPFSFGVRNRIIDGEERWMTFGSLSTGEILAVAHTICEMNGEEIIRIISARRATPHERKRFEQGT
jgi:uncharacterized DUF497 family protein